MARKEFLILFKTLRGEFKKGPKKISFKDKKWEPWFYWRKVEMLIL